MKQAVSPAVAVIVIVIVVAVVVVAIWKFSRGGKMEVKQPDIPNMTMDPGAGKMQPITKGDPNNPAPPMMQQMQGSKGGE